MHVMLVDTMKNAVVDVFNDDSVSKDEIIISLEELVELIKGMIIILKEGK